ncbi:MAG: sugar ABC transporter permease [Spirochaetota bacterium]|nr:MAG: sugar ABC transporter permease [Spirochaetota bacterium]
MAISELKKRQKIRKRITAILFVLPALLFLVMFVAYPVFQSIALSLFKWDGAGSWEFNGLENYRKMFTTDRYFWTALKNTILFTVLMTCGEMFLGFIYSVLVDLGVRGWKIFRFIFFLPVTLSQVAISLLFVKIFQEDGLVNAMLGFLNLEGLQHIWLGEIKYAMWCLIITSWWIYGGWHMVFFLAGMQSINPEIYEQAKIDGASTLRRVFVITVPLLKNVWFVLIALSFILGFKMFTLVYIMTTEGPSFATVVLGTRIYRYAFWVHKYGYASTWAVVMVVASLIFAILYVKFTGYREEALAE